MCKSNLILNPHRASNQGLYIMDYLDTIYSPTKTNTHYTIIRGNSMVEQTNI